MVWGNKKRLIIIIYHVKRSFFVLATVFSVFTLTDEIAFVGHQTKLLI